MGLINPCL